MSPLTYVVQRMAALDDSELKGERAQPIASQLNSAVSSSWAALRGEPMVFSPAVAAMRGISTVTVGPEDM